MKELCITKLAERMDYPVGEYMTENKPIIKEMVRVFKNVEEFEGKFVNLICRGSSGAIIAGLFSLLIKNENKIVHIKKEGETSHMAYATLKKGADCINVIVDDFVCTGNTLNEIYDRITKSNGISVKIHGLIVSGEVKIKNIHFNPEIIICGAIDEG